MSTADLQQDSKNAFAPLFQKRHRRQSHTIFTAAFARLQQSKFCHVEGFVQFRCIFTKVFSRWIRRSMMAFVLFFVVHFSAVPPATAVPSSGRMGGSVHKPRHSTTKLRYSAPSRPNSSHWAPTAPRGPSYRVIPLRTGYHHHYHHHYRPAQDEFTTTVTSPDGTTTVVRKQSRQLQRFSLTDMILVTGAATFIAYGVSKHLAEKAEEEGGPDSPLGHGVSVLSLTACLNVSNRKDPNSILKRLEQLAMTSNTSNRKGLQELMSETSLELARQEKAILSVESHYSHTKSATQGERLYNRLSAEQRSKFDRESLSNYGGKVTKSQRRNEADASLPAPSATVALVNIHLAIEGNSLRAFDNIKSRKQLQEALSRISSDSQVDDCLLAAEVIWSPEDPLEQITMEDVYSDFPTLQILLD
jgi:uncharacterized membrane protein